MSNGAIIALEIKVVVNVPLLLLYLRGRWPLRTVLPCLLSIPVLWYLTYSLLHESSHVAATYVVDGKVVDYKLIPRFWMGEFGRAWIKSDGLTQIWQQLVSSCSPYVLDVLCIVVGMVVLRRDFFRNPFVVGATMERRRIAKRCIFLSLVRGTCGDTRSRPD